MTDLRIAKGLALPLDYITKTAAILAKRRVGKTYAGAVLAEEFVKAGLPFYALDPTSAWWGLRASADGKSEGLPVVVIGGDHGDIALHEGAGNAIADLIVEEPGFYVIDLSVIDESHAATVRFATAFLDRLYRIKGRHRDPLHGFWDEADVFAPQRPGNDETRMLGAAEAIVRRGGLRGLGTTLITQRAAVLNKNVLTQIDILIALRIMGPQDRDAVDDYLKNNAGPDRRREILDSLGSLRVGEAWVYGPGEEPPLYERIQVRERRTFNSSATPKPGEKRIEPKRLADVDVKRIEQRLTASIERAQAEDPKRLRARIGQLERQVRELEQRKPAPPEPERVEVPVVGDEQLERLEAFAGRIAVDVSDLQAAARGIEDALALVRSAQVEARRPTPTPPPSPRAVTPAPRAVRRDADRPLPEGVTPAKQRILDALAALEAIGVTPADRTQLALFAKVSPKSSGYANNLGALRSAGLIDYPSGRTAALTPEGRGIADVGGVPTSADELHAYVRSLVGPAKGRILDALIDAYPEPLAKEQLAERAAASPTSSGYANNLGSLRSLGLIDYPAPGQVAALPVLFPAGVPA